jgi:hypothetical protein
MPTLAKIGTTATRVQESPDGSRSLWYHDTEVVRVKGPWVVLRTDGYWTVTTKTRMNQASNQWGLGFKVSQFCGVWRVTCWSPSGVFLSEHSFKGEGIRFNWQTGELG